MYFLSYVSQKSMDFPSIWLISKTLGLLCKRLPAQAPPKKFGLARLAPILLHNYTPPVCEKPRCTTPILSQNLSNFDIYFRATLTTEDIGIIRDGSKVCVGKDGETFRVLLVIPVPRSGLPIVGTFAISRSLYH